MKKGIALSPALIVLILLLILPVNAQGEEKGGLKPLVLNQEGAITPDFIEKLQSSLTPDGVNRARQNALSNNNIQNVTLNSEIMAKHNKLFTNRIKTGKITNQHKSGRCWIFAALNILRPKFLEKYKLDTFEFSQNYLFFWDKMEKSNLFLESIIATRECDTRDRRVRFILEDPFADGGQWNYVVALINKYGVVPKELMKETENSLNSSAMDDIVSTLLRKDASLLRTMHRQGKSERALRQKKEEMLGDVYRILIFCLGTPPQQFAFRYEDKDKKASSPHTYTPREFCANEVGVDLADYLCIYSVPTWPYNKLFQIDLDRNMVEKPNITLININDRDMKAYTLKSVLNNDPVWFGADVSKDMNRTSGIMAKNLYDFQDMFGIDFSLAKSERILYYDTTVSHAMVIMGADLDNGVPVKWLVENSWGEANGDAGYYYMYDTWFDEYVYQVILHKKYLPAEVLNILKTEPTILPEDDPMRAL